jgi:uncharacterized membrane protein YdbT with pleckstrin-like domain
MAEITVAALRRIELFESLKRKDLEALTELFQREEFTRGDEVFRQGQQGQKAYYVKHGTLLARHVDPQGLEQRRTLVSEDFFGETSLLLSEPHDATVLVSSDVVLLSLDKDTFTQFLRANRSVLGTLRLREDIAKKLHAPRFTWQDPDEVTIIALHKHNLILWQRLTPAVFVGLLGLVCFAYGVFYLGSLGLLPTLVLIAGVLLLIGAGGFLWYLIVDHLNDNYVVTNRRVVHEERRPFGRESRAEAPLHAIQDIQQSKSGTMAHIYNFGDLIIQTAGERVHVVFRLIPDPAGTREAIFEQIQRAQAWARAEERASILDAMRDRFELPSLQEKEEEPESKPEETASRLHLTPPPWMSEVTRVLRYFLPPMRHEEGETITWRKHWITLIPALWLPTAIIMALTVGIVAALSLLPAQTRIVLLLVYGVALVGLLPWWIWQFDDWRNDIYQVTDNRIIDIEKRPFFGREERREANLGVVQDINSERPSFLARILNYGSVTVETAGIEPFTFDYVKDPGGVQAEIFRRAEAFRARQRQQESERRRSELLDWFTVYDQIRGAPPPPDTLQSQPQET